MGRIWHKMIPMKLAHEQFGMFNGSWSRQLDRCWESEDGYAVGSRMIRTEWGAVEHVTIQRLFSGGDIPWAVKQEIKDELFGEKRMAIEVFPAAKNLIDVCDIYHLWVLPKDFKLPFGIHPTRDPEAKVVNRGYDYDLNECKAWCDSETRKRLMDGRY